MHSPAVAPGPSRLRLPIVEPWILALVVGLLVIALGVTWLVVSRRSDVEPYAEERETPASPVETAGLAGRLTTASQALGGALRGAFGRGEVDGEFWESMEEALVAADVGISAATDLVARVKERRPAGTDEAREDLRAELVAELAGSSRSLSLGESKPAVVLVVGVNGSGKTTTIAKLARRLQDEGRVPLLGAADTFRAAADAQIRTWGERLGVDVVGGQEGSDPASVAFDAYTAARSRGRDVVLVDTAGRLQAKHNLMAELAKVKRVVEREAGEIGEVLLVLDATGGQNGISQAEEFTATVGVTGIVLTKLDGTARGGIVVAVERSLGVPVKFVGLGESVEDLVPFDHHEFVEALLADA